MKKGLCLVLGLLIVLSSFPMMATATDKPAAFTSAMDPVPEKITLTAMRPSWQDVRPPAEDLWMFKRYEEITNIHIQWEEVPREGYGERKNIILASNDLPDLFYQGWFTTKEILDNGSSGAFIALDDIIPECNPSLTAVLEKYPDLKKALTMADGHIYSYPRMLPEVFEASQRYYINGEWLDNLGLSVPTTTDEMTEVLKAFRDQDANGNGDPNDEYPIDWVNGTSGEPLTGMPLLMGSFGIGNRGSTVSGGNARIDMGTDGKVRFIPTSEGYKNYLSQLKLWWDEKLFHPQTFTGEPYAQWVADGQADQVGLFQWVHPLFLGADVGRKYRGITTLKGPEGDATFTAVGVPWSISAMMITSANKYPKESAAWVDFFFSPEGTVFGYLGEEGVTYNVDENGDKVYVDEILNYKGGTQLGAFQWLDNVYGGGYPFMDMDYDTLLKAQKKDLEKDFLFLSRTDHEQYMPEEIWPVFPGTTEELDELTPLLTDMNTYIDECFTKFITGDMSLENDWDAYVSTLNQMGAERYLEIRQIQYERYSGAE